MTDAIVVGGGLSGATAAAHLARAGRSVCLLEREAAPAHKVCGEFLTAEAMSELARLDIDLPALGAVAITDVRLFAGGRSAAAALPFAAAGLSRHALDPAVRAAAGAAGADVRLGARAVAIDRTGVTLSDGLRLSARRILVATGKHRVRGLPRRTPPRPHDAKVGFKQHLRLSPAAQSIVAGTVELHLFKGGYAGLMPVEGGRCNLSLVVTPGAWAAAGRRFEPLLAGICAEAPGLGDRLAGSEAIFPRPLAVSDVPYGYRAWADPLARDDGLWWVGDQAAVTPSLTGAGMALALRGGRLLAERLADERATPGDATAMLRRQFRRQMAWARLFEGLLESSPSARGLVMLADRFPGLLTAASRLTRLPA
ncbi:NAD(P)/FAD-dependent oxidoreductase [Roseisalinus antarcticus]|uniref:Putative oxidoreductase/MT0587 n=1 Tax=Roseisalinus antarcticus TaxID=254357 RepID=A0A1Y5TFX9_9RHOB|nr:FAD-dependent oxidoreductase [Roseisalinus antarcticus]SLN60962.1 Putative oxidoreductase/MT0587 [Roseisalinus antarcticus]